MCIRDSSTDGAGPVPEARDPLVTGAIELQRQKSPQTSPFQPRAFTNTDSYNFTYAQGWVTGTSANLTWNNSRTTSTGFTSFSPQLQSSFNATVTQHLLAGAGIWVNNRFVYEDVYKRQTLDGSWV